jgi:UDP-glucose 4-epimerase
MSRRSGCGPRRQTVGARHRRCRALSVRSERARATLPAGRQHARRGRRMTQRVLVTGGAGFIGSHVCEVFPRRGGPSSSSMTCRAASAKTFRRRDAARRRHSVLRIRRAHCERLVRRDRASRRPDRRAPQRRRTGVRCRREHSRDHQHSRVDSPSRQPGQNARRVPSTGGAIYGDLVSPPTLETEPKEPDSPYAISKLSVEYFSRTTRASTGSRR